MRFKPHLSFLVVALTIVLSACSSSSAVDQERLDGLIADPMADYQPPTGELTSSFEEAGKRYYALGGEWEEDSSSVVRRWSTNAPQAEIVDDVVAALDGAGWTLTSENNIGSTASVTAIKPQNGFCLVASVIIKETERGRVELSLDAPYSGSDRTWCPDE